MLIAEISIYKIKPFCSHLPIHTGDFRLYLWIVEITSFHYKSLPSFHNFSCRKSALRHKLGMSAIGSLGTSEAVDDSVNEVSVILHSHKKNVQKLPNSKQVLLF
ncbi:uncharacterized protein LOC124203840 [Daphnia pulex]|uniref:uncharacterized protein LOC124203840 n=1 Tax=Daphnia pulex TaxID=6669 RepID=UPI001EDE53FB|nr:uncharacterized protein LOC124203840 [Daphnia pulex]